VEPKGSLSYLKWPSLYPILSQLNPIHILTPYVFKIDFVSILLSMSRCWKWCALFRINFLLISYVLFSNIFFVHVTVLDLISPKVHSPHYRIQFFKFILILSSHRTYLSQMISYLYGLRLNFVLISYCRASSACLSWVQKLSSIYILLWRGNQVWYPYKNKIKLVYNVDLPPCDGHWWP
jgi:hypothetical protein